MHINFLETSIIKINGKFDNEVLCTIYENKNNTEVIGVCNLSEYKKRGFVYLFGLFVSNKHRRKGVGTFLIHEIINYCRNNYSVKDLVLKVDKINKDGIEFYQNIGFKVYKTLKNTLCMNYKL